MLLKCLLNQTTRHGMMTMTRRLIQRNLIDVT